MNELKIPKAIADLMTEGEMAPPEARKWVLDQLRFFDQIPDHAGRGPESWIALKMTCTIAQAGAAIRWAKKLKPKPQKQMRTQKEIRDRLKVLKANLKDMEENFHSRCRAAWQEDVEDMARMGRGAVSPSFRGPKLISFEQVERETIKEAKRDIQLLEWVLGKED